MFIVRLRASYSDKLRPPEKINYALSVHSRLKQNDDNKIIKKYVKNGHEFVTWLCFLARTVCLDP